jgi:hypothetical protein
LGVRRIEPRRAGRQGRYRSIKLQELGVGAELKRKAWADALNLARVG